MEIGKALALLEKDTARNINMINFIRSYLISTVDIVGNSVMIRGRSDEEWVYISSQSVSELLRLRESLRDSDTCFAVLEDWMLPYIIMGREIRSRLSSLKLVYNPLNPLPPVRSTVTRLSESDAAYIYENSKYKEFIDVEYITERIRHGIGLGIVDDCRLVAWALTHDDGAIGFLNVLDDYRRKGYGTDVTVSVIRRLLEIGETPFVHIEQDNKASLKLAEKAGFKEVGRIHWIKL